MTRDLQPSGPEGLGRGVWVLIGMRTADVVDQDAEDAPPAQLLAVAGPKQRSFGSLDQDHARWTSVYSTTSTIDHSGVHRVTLHRGRRVV